MSKTQQPPDANNLLHAAGCGNVDLVQDMLAKGMSVNAANQQGYTPLMSACASYRVEVVSLLLQAGALVGLKTTDGRTALHAAVGSTSSQPERQRDCVRILLENQAGIDVQDQSGLSPLMNAAWFGCTLAVQELVKHGASTALRDAKGRTAEDLARAKNREEVANLLRQRI